MVFMLKVHAKKLGNVTVLCLQGQIVNGETKALRDSMNSMLQTSVLILDFSRVTTVDAHGLGVLLELRAQTEENGIRFKLINVSKHLLKVFEITRLDTVFQISSAVEFFPAAASHRAMMQALKSCA
ncbi:MAG: hypothetical protein C5B55_15170 [Blastocatellia bacterium]|nr:MAG: hypothetical protein C5B55_15170 [Blastocatellia bacterium]